MPAPGGTLPSRSRRSTTACLSTCDAPQRDPRRPLNVDSGRLRRNHAPMPLPARAGCRPMLLAIPPFKSARARAIGARMSAFGGCSTTSVEGASAQGDASLTPVQAPKTASLLVSRPWPWTCAVATSSTSWKRWRDARFVLAHQPGVAHHVGGRSNKLYGKAKATPTGRRRGPAAKSVGKPDAGSAV